MFIAKKMRKCDKKYTIEDKQAAFQQFIYGASGVIFALFSLIIGNSNPIFTAVSAILAAAVGIVSLANGGILCYNTVKGDVKTRKKIKQYIWSALAAAYAVFIAAMQLYCFWKL